MDNFQGIEPREPKWVKTVVVIEIVSGFLFLLPVLSLVVSQGFNAIRYWIVLLFPFLMLVGGFAARRQYEAKNYKAAKIAILSFIPILLMGFVASFFVPWIYALFLFAV